MSALRANQRLALRAMLSGASYVEAARRAGVSDRTLRRWRGSPDFDAELAEGQREIERSARSRLVALVADAVEVFVESIRVDRSPVMSWRLLRGLGLLSESVHLGGRVAVEARSLPSDLDLGRLIAKEDLPALLAASRAVAAGLRGEEVPERPVEPEVEPEVAAVEDEEPARKEPEEDHLARALQVFAVRRG